MCGEAAAARQRSRSHRRSARASRALVCQSRPPRRRVADSHAALPFAALRPSDSHCCRWLLPRAAPAPIPPLRSSRGAHPADDCCQEGSCLSA
eukprot:5633262-Pleurochrysis_carterae.AAC.1